MSSNSDLENDIFMTVKVEGIAILEIKYTAVFFFNVFVDLYVGPTDLRYTIAASRSFSQIDSHLP